MRFRCQGCGTVYRVPDEKIGPTGRNVRCKKCGTSNLVHRSGEDDQPTAPGAARPKSGPAPRPASPRVDPMDAQTRIAESPVDAMDAQTRIAESSDGLDAMDAKTVVAQSGLDWDDDGVRRKSADGGGDATWQPAGRVEGSSADDWDDQPTVVATYNESGEAMVGGMRIGHSDHADLMSQMTAVADPASMGASEGQAAGGGEERAPDIRTDEPSTAASSGGTSTRRGTHPPPGAARPHAPDPSLGDELFSDSVVERVGPAEQDLTLLKAEGMRPGPAQPEPPGASVANVGDGVVVRESSPLLRVLLVLVILAAAGGGAYYYLRIYKAGDAAGDVAATVAPANGTAAKAATAPAPPAPSADAGLDEEMAALKQAAGGAVGKRASALVAQALTREEAGDPLGARVLAASALVLDDRQDARGVLARLDDVPRPTFLWRNVTGARCEALSYAPDGQELACGEGAHVLVWSLASGEERARLRGHAGPVHAVAHSPNGLRLAVGVNDGTVHLWDLARAKETGQLAAHRQAVDSVVFSPDGQLLATASAGERVVRLWTVATAKPAGRLLGHRKGVTAVRFSADGKQVISASGDGKVHLWDLESLKERRSFEAHPEAVTTMAVAAGGGLATGGADGALKLWNPDAAESGGRVIGNHQTAVTGLAFATNGTVLVSSAADSVRLWPLEATGGDGAVYQHDDRVLSLAVSPDQNQLASASSAGSLSLRDLGSDQLVRRLAGVAGPLRSVNFSPDGTQLGAACDDGSVRIWDVATREERVLRPGGVAGPPIHFALFSPTGDRMATGNGRTVDVWEYPSFKNQIQQFSPARTAAFSPDGAQLAFEGESFAVRLWDLLAGRELGVYPGATDSASALFIGPNNRFLLAGSVDGTARIWYLGYDDSAVRRGSPADGVTSLVFVTKHRLILFGTSQGSIRRWLLVRGVEEKPLKAASGVTALAASNDGARFLSGHSNGRAILWDIATMKPLLQLPPHRGPVTSVAFSPGDELLATASADRTARIWRVSGAAAPVKPAELSGSLQAAELYKRERRASRLRLSGTSLELDPLFYATELEAVSPRP